MRATLQSLFIGTVVAMLTVLAAPAVRAQTAASTFVQTAAFTFDLPAQPLADSLRAVASVTRINIVFDPNVVAGMQAPPLRGSATAREALRTLLAGTGLRPVSVSAGTIRISRITAHDRIAARAATGSSGTATIPGATASSPGMSAPAAAAGSDPPARRGSDDSETSSPTHSAAQDVSRAQLSEVVVTGTRIAGEVPTSPVITLGRTEIDESGYSSVGQILLSLPENFSGGQNPGVVGARGNNQYPTGASTANLFGLGPDSTLTLVDGHRLAYDGYQNGVDLSLIPLAAVDRIEIMTDGGSAIYGSDAVAGVVNVILKQHYEGVTADARYGDVTAGQAAQAQYSVLAGHDWGSGNAVIAYEYSHDDPLYASERSFSLAAEQPTTLFPELNRSSTFLSAHQSLSDGVMASVDALYTRRSYVSVTTLEPQEGNATEYAETGITEFGISPEISIALPRNWTLSLDGTISKDRDTEDYPYFNASTHVLLSQGQIYYQNRMQLGQVEASGTAFELPSGPVKLAVGAGYRSESFDAVPSDNEDVTHASRDVRFGYVELDVPVIRPDAGRTLLNSVNLTAAYRYEDYSDFGAQSTPKAGIAYVPIESVRLRATWSRSFRAPEFEYEYGLRQAYILPGPYLGGAPGTDAMLLYGSNPDLGPERATSRTVGVDFTPAFAPGLKLSATYFYIDYADRIVQPINNTVNALVDPLYSAFLVLHPTPGQQSAVIAQSNLFENETGAPYDPTSITALVDDDYQNATLQRIHGLDLTVEQGFPAMGGRMNLAANGAWLTLRQRTISAAPETLISGTIFNPPSFKGRGTANWRRGGWSFTAAYNYVDSEWDNSNSPAVHVGSWSTVDVQLAYTFDESTFAVLRRLKLSLSVQNLFDRYPPFVAASSTAFPGLGYDSTNASPFGRFISAFVSKSW